MKKEKIKYYDPELAWTSNKLKNSISILIAFLIGFALGIATMKIELEKLENVKYDQYVQIKSLEETIEKYKRGEF